MSECKCQSTSNLNQLKLSGPLMKKVIALAASIVIVCVSLPSNKLNGQPPKTNSKIDNRLELILEGEEVSSTAHLAELFGDLTSANSRGVAAGYLVASTSPSRTREYVNGENKALALLFLWNLFQNDAINQVALETFEPKEKEFPVEKKILNEFRQRIFFDLVQKTVQAKPPENWQSLVSNYMASSIGPVYLAPQSVSNFLEKSTLTLDQKQKVVSDKLVKSIVIDNEQVQLKGCDLPEDLGVFEICRTSKGNFLLTDINTISPNSETRGICELFFVNPLGEVIWKHDVVPWDLDLYEGSFRYAQLVVSEHGQEVTVFFATSVGFGIDVIDIESGLTKLDFQSLYPKPFREFPGG